MRVHRCRPCVACSAPRPRRCSRVVFEKINRCCFGSPRYVRPSVTGALRNCLHLCRTRRHLSYPSHTLCSCAGASLSSVPVRGCFQVREHGELQWLLACHTPVGWLNRMTQFKQKSAGDKNNATLGLYAYPVLQAADVLLYRATGRSTRVHPLLCAVSLARADSSVCRPRNGFVCVCVCVCVRVCVCVCRTMTVAVWAAYPFSRVFVWLSISHTYFHTVAYERPVAPFRLSFGNAASWSWAHFAGFGVGYVKTSCEHPVAAVPVGEDQKQHLELARSIATSFNHAVSHTVFPLPEPLISTDATMRIMSLRDGTKKMSKSDASEMSRIDLTGPDPRLLRCLLFQPAPL